MFTPTLLVLSITALSYSVTDASINRTSETWGPIQIFERHDTIPENWLYAGPAPGEKLLDLKLFLDGDHETLSQKTIQMSNPDHEDYGVHLNQKQLAQIVSATESQIHLVKKWLSSQPHVSNITYFAQGDFLSFQMTVEAASQFLNTTFSVYQDIQSGSNIIRSNQYSLPGSIGRETSIIHPITYFPKRRSSGLTIKDASLPSIAPRQATKANQTVLKACADGIYPKCIATLYNIVYTPPLKSQSCSRLGVAGFLGQYINHTDVNYFLRKYGNSASTRANPGNFTVELVNGGKNNETAWGIEATVDMEYSMAFTGSLPVTYYSTAGTPPQLGPGGSDGKPLPASSVVDEPYLAWVNYLVAKPDGEIPQVISISYSDVEQEIPKAYADHVCKLFGKLAARGVSVIDASGDGGVAGVTASAVCQSNDGKKTKKFLPTFPASCPWVTSVGATGFLPEQGASLSAGGYSNYFPVPKWQKNATSSYIKYLGGQYKGLYNASGRGIPDVALYGLHYETENGNVTTGQHSGTSAGTPVFAAMIALLNDLRLRNKQPVLGWLNPLLYSAKLSGVWTDITEGVSYGCEEKWNATKGWDTVTGLGTPDFLRFAKALGLQTS